MRIDTLRLIAYGHFRDTVLDLSQGKQGLHVIFGPNEAGKSTTLRAITNVLFGFRHQADDAFVFQNRDLRVGARIVSDDGKPIDCVRRKAKKDSLYDAQDASPIDEAQLASLLRGVDRDAFLERYGITHQSLVEGGQLIVRGGGDVGQSLFAAGSGLGQLREFQETIDAQCGELFKKGGTRSTINRLLIELREKRAELKASQLQVGDFVQLETDREFAATQAETFRKASQETRGGLMKAEALRDAIPLVRELDELQEQLAELAAVPTLGAGFSQRYQEAVVAYRSMEKQIAQLRERLAETRQQCDAVACDEKTLSLAETIESLVQELGSVKKAEHQKPGLVKRRRTLLSNIDSQLKSLGLQEHSDPGSIDLPQPLRVKVSELATQHPALVQRAQQSEDEWHSLQQQLQQLETSLERTGEPGDTSALESALLQAGDQRGLSQQLDELQSSLDQHQTVVANQMRQLNGYSGTAEACAELSLPSDATVEKYVDEFVSSENRHKLLTEKEDEVAGRLRQLEAQLQEIALHGKVPTERELDDLRGERDRQGQLLRKHIESKADGESKDDAREDFVAIQSTFFRLVSDCDALADRLRREADRVARRAKLEADVMLEKRGLEKIATHKNEAASNREALENSWLAIWQPLEIEALSPREMLAWLREQRKVVAMIAERDAAAARRRQLEQRIETVRSLLVDATAKHQADDGEDASDSLTSDELSALSLSDLVAIARRCQEAFSQRETLRRDLIREIDAVGLSIPVAEKLAKKNAAALKDWQQQWTEVADRLGLEKDASPRAASSFIETYQDVLRLQSQADDLQHRIEGIESDSEMFYQRVRSVPLSEGSHDSKHSDNEEPSSNGEPSTKSETAEPEISSVVETWQTQLAQARSADAIRNKYHEQIASDAERLQTLEDDFSASTVALEVLCQEAVCDDKDKLIEVQQRSSEKQRLIDRKHQTLDRLKTLARAESLDVFVSKVREADADALEAQISDLAGKIDEVERNREEACRTLGKLDEQRSAMDGGARAAAIQQELHGLLGQIRHHSQQYARLNVAGTLLKTAINRYREQNQAPILSIATDYFKRLTLGRFSGLRTDDNRKGDPVLYGVRSDNGESVDVAGMSQGTADQLYLALRLASLKHSLKAGESMPLIVDDILIQCDQDRSGAAFELLAELSRETQVIFFTHDASLVNLAKETLSADQMFVQTLHASQQTPDKSEPPENTESMPEKNVAEREPVVTQDDTSIKRQDDSHRLPRQEISVSEDLGDTKKLSRRKRTKDPISDQVKTAEARPMTQTEAEAAPAAAQTANATQPDPIAASDSDSEDRSGFLF